MQDFPDQALKNSCYQLIEGEENYEGCRIASKEISMA